MKKSLVFAAVAMLVVSGTAFAKGGSSAPEIVNVVDQSNVSAVATDGADAVAGGIYAQDTSGLVNVVSESKVSAVATDGALAVAGGIDAIGSGCTTCGPITNVVSQSKISAVATDDSTAVAGGVISR